MGSRTFNHVKCTSLFCRDNEMTWWDNALHLNSSYGIIMGFYCTSDSSRAFLRLCLCIYYSLPILSFSRLAPSCPSKLMPDTTSLTPSCPHYPLPTNGIRSPNFILLIAYAVHDLIVIASVRPIVIVQTQAFLFSIFLSPSTHTHTCVLV